MFENIWYLQKKKIYRDTCITFTTCFIKNQDYNTQSDSIIIYSDQYDTVSPVMISYYQES